MVSSNGDLSRPTTIATAARDDHILETKQDLVECLRGLAGHGGGQLSSGSRVAIDSAHESCRSTREEGSKGGFRQRRNSA